jgi:hypothetical protein
VRVVGGQLETNHRRWPQVFQCVESRAGSRFAGLKSLPVK